MKILTWNMQGYGGLGEKPTLLAGLLNKGEYDVVCLQEATQPLLSFQCLGTNNGVEIYQLPAPRHGQRAVNQINNYTALYYAWGNVNMRCSLVTYVKNFADFKHCGIVHDMNNHNARPMLWTFHNGLYIGNIHLISGNEPIAIQQFNNFRAVMPAGVPYCIIGDYNINSFNNRGIISLNNHFYDVGIYDQSTHTGNACLDYMYSPHMMPSAFLRLDQPGRYSDHSPVEYNM